MTEPGAPQTPAADERWPAWAVDAAIAAGVSAALLAAVAGVAGGAGTVVALLMNWAKRRRSNGASTGVKDVRTWFDRDVEAPGAPALKFTRDLRAAIGRTLTRQAYPQGWVAGGRSARSMLPYAGARVPRGVRLSVDWSGWEPGDWQAARRLVDERGDASGFRALLDEADVQIKGIADHKLDEVARCLADGLASGDTPEQIAADLRATLEDRTWAMTVAWTETSRAIAAAADDQYRQAGIRTHGWMTALDQRVCPKCTADELAGFVDIAAPFPSGTLRPPGHPRCRCALIPGPVPDEEDDVTLAVVADLTKDFDPDQPRDDHGRWSKIGAALNAISQAAGAAVVGHEVFGGEHGRSDSHGIVVAHPGGDYSIALHDKDVGTQHVMSLPDDDAREELRQAFDDIWTAHRRDPRASGSVEADDGAWQVQYNEHGATLYANLDDDEALEEVLLSHDDVETLETALSSVGDALSAAQVPGYTPPLAPSEEVRPRSRKRLGGANDEFVGAVQVVDTPDGPRVRLGTIAQNENGIKQWTGGHGKTTVDLGREDAARLAGALEGMEADGRERQKIYDRHISAAEARSEAGEDVDWWQVDADIRGELPAESLDETDSSSTFEEAYGVRLIDTPWGTVRLTDTGMDDEANAHHRHVRLDIWPSGMSEEEYDEGNPDHASWAWPGSQWQKPAAQLQPKDVKALIKILRDTFGDVEKAAKPGQRGSSWEHQWKYGKLRSKWVGHPHPWTALYHHLRKHMPDEMAKRTAAQWHHDVFGIWPGEKKGDNPVGPG